MAKNVFAPPSHKSEVASANATNVAAEVYSFPVDQFTQVVVRIKNAGATALNSFSILAALDRGLSHDAVLSSQADLWTTPKRPVVSASKDLTVLAGGNVAFLILDVRGFHAISFKTSVAAGNTALEFSHNGSYA